MRKKDFPGDCQGEREKAMRSGWKGGIDMKPAEDYNRLRKDGRSDDNEKKDPEADDPAALVV